MADIVVDTNVVSYLLRGDSRGAPYGSYLVGKRAAVSFMTVGELRSWALIRGWGQPRKERLALFLQQYTVVYADDGLCDAWASIISDGIGKGRPVTPADAWIAAPASMTGIPLMTHNANYFETITGLEIVSFPGS